MCAPHPLCTNHDGDAVILSPKFLPNTFASFFFFFFGVGSILFKNVFKRTREYLPFPPYITLCKFRLYSVMVWYTYIGKCLPQFWQSTNYQCFCFTSHSYRSLVVVVRLLKLYSHNNFHVYNAVILTVICYNHHAVH